MSNYKFALYTESKESNCGDGCCYNSWQELRMVTLNNEDITVVSDLSYYAVSHIVKVILRELKFFNKDIASLSDCFEVENPEFESIFMSEFVEYDSRDLVSGLNDSASEELMLRELHLFDFSKEKYTRKSYFMINNNYFNFVHAKEDETMLAICEVLERLGFQSSESQGGISFEYAWFIKPRFLVDNE